jgi:hypothetical protein
VTQSSLALSVLATDSLPDWRRNSKATSLPGGWETGKKDPVAFVAAVVFRCWAVAVECPVPVSSFLSHVRIQFGI